MPHVGAHPGFGGGQYSFRAVASCRHCATIYHSISSNILKRIHTSLISSVANSRAHTPIERESEMEKFTRFVRNESNAFVVESGLMVALITAVIVLRVIQFAHGS
jgi:hypothetical protein